MRLGEWRQSLENNCNAAGRVVSGVGLRVWEVMQKEEENRMEREARTGSAVADDRRMSRPLADS